MTAQRFLRRVLLAALLCALLVSAVLAADPASDASEHPVDTVASALKKLDDTVAAGKASFFLYPQDGESSTRDELIENIKAHVWKTWVDVSPRILATYDMDSDGVSTLKITLRYAEKTGDYDKALDEAVSACIRDGMTGLEKTASIYSWLADTSVRTTGRDTAYEALVDKRADCFGIAAAFRAIAQKAGLTCTVVRGQHYGSKGWREHVWNAVKIGKGDDETGGVWHYVDASRADSAWTPGHADYAYLLFGTDKSGYSATIEDENITISSEAYKDDSLGFSRREVPAPLILTDNGFWMIRHINNNTTLCLAPYGTNFQMESLAAIIPNNTSMMIYAAAVVDGVIYYSRNFPSADGRTYALYSFVPGGGEAVEVRETGLSAKFGIRVSGRKLELVQGGTAALTMPLRRYSDITKRAWLAYDADAAPGTLSTANVRLIGGTDGAQIIAAFYDSAGRMRAAQVTSAAAPTFSAAPSGCAEVRLFAVSAEGAPLTAKLILTK